MNNSSRALKGVLLGLALVLAQLPAHAAETVLATGANGIAVTNADVLAEVSNAPAEARPALLKPETIGKLIGTIYSRRYWASLNKDPQAAVQAKLVGESALAEGYLEKFKGDVPAGTVLENLAKTEYKVRKAEFVGLEQVQVRHILVRKERPNAEALAQEVLAKAKAGEDFATLATAYSDDAATQPRGGDLGFVQKGQLVPEFEEAAFALKKAGDLSGIVKTEFGFHVIKLIAREEKRPLKFEEVKDKLQKQVVDTLVAKRLKRENENAQAALVLDKAAIEAFLAKPN